MRMYPEKSGQRKEKKIMLPAVVTAVKIINLLIKNGTEKGAFTMVSLTNFWLLWSIPSLPNIETIFPV